MTAPPVPGPSRLLRILYVSDTGDQLGGAERSLLSLIEHLDQSRYQAHVVLGEDGRFASLLRAAHAKVILARVGTIARSRNPLRLLLYAAFFVHGTLRLAWHIRRRRIGVVHVNKNPLAVHAVPAARLAGAAVVWHVRNRVSNFGRIGAWLVRHCHRILCVSRSIAAPFIEAFPEAEPRITIVHEGIDATLYTAREAGAAFRQAVAARPQQHLVGTVGRLTPWKCQDDFLRAAAIVAPRHPDALFPVVGDCVSSRAEQAPDRAWRDRLHALAAELGIADRVVFTGFREDVPAVMNGLDVFVLPSHDEPFGIVVLEAMAAARPIVAAAGGGVPEIVADGQHALLVEPGNVEAMAEAIDRILSSPDLAARLGRAAEEHVVAEFPLWRHAAAVRAVYGDLAPAERQ